MTPGRGLIRGVPVLPTSCACWELGGRGPENWPASAGVVAREDDSSWPFPGKGAKAAACTNRKALQDCCTG